MKRFSQLFSEIDRTNRTNEKVRALVNYFNEANPEDAAWALYFLTENDSAALLPDDNCFNGPVSQVALICGCCRNVMIVWETLLKRWRC